MPAEEFAELVADIKANGLRDQAVIYEGMVLDGWHRMKACHAAGASFRYDYYKGKDPVGFVKSKNLHRRSLTASQRAAAILACHEWTEHRQNARAADGKFFNENNGVQGGNRSATLPNGEPAMPAPATATAAELAKEAGVSERTIVDAKAAIDAGMGEALREGTVSANKAAQVARARNKPARTPRPMPTDKRDARIAELEKENADLKEQLEDARGNLHTLAIDAEVAAAIEKDETALALKKQIAEVARLTRLNDDLMDHNHQMQSQLKAVQRKLDKLERMRGAA